MRYVALPLALLAAALAGCAPEMIDSPLPIPEQVAEQNIGTDCTLRFSGHRWCVRQERRGGPGPNAWSADNVWVDEAGLHLKLSEVEGQWIAAEVYTATAFGFGSYEFRLGPGVAQLDPNVVLGLFSYADGAADGTQEIDIELARWGESQANNLSYTVWPRNAGGPSATRAWSWVEPGASVHRYTWSKGTVLFQSYAARSSGGGTPARQWRYEPKRGAQVLPQQPMPVHLNLWLYRGAPPRDGREVEVVIESFRYTPDRAP